MNLVFLIPLFGLCAHNGHWLFFRYQGNHVETITGYAEQNARTLIAQWEKEFPPLSPSVELLADLKEKIDPTRYPEWLKQGKVRLLGGPTSSEIHDFSATATMEDIQRVFFGNNARYFSFIK